MGILMSYKGGTYTHVPAWTVEGPGKPLWGNKNPGPGSYQLPGTFGTTSKDPKYSFGKGVKKDIDLGVPGPGAYGPDDGHGPRKTALDKKPRFDPFDTLVPGPGAYESSRVKGVGYSFGKQKRVTPVKPAGPDYEIPDTIPDVAPYNYPSKP